MGVSRLVSVGKSLTFFVVEGRTEEKEDERFRPGFRIGVRDGHSAASDGFCFKTGWIGIGSVITSVEFLVVSLLMVAGGGGSPLPPLQ